MHSPLSTWAAALGVVNHFFFHKYEPSSANVPFLLLFVQPIALLLLVGGGGGPLTSCAIASDLVWSYAVFLGSLGLSIAVYRLSPLHPLAQYPGPAIGKVTKLWSVWKTAHGYKYLYHKELHDRYGPYVRTGPNELSIIDAPAVSQILGSGGLEKGRYYESGRHSATPPSIVCVSGEAHTAKRRVWNRAMSSAALREYEPLIAKRASQLISRLRDQGSDGASDVDLVHWLDLFAYDLMGDLAFGGGFEMLRDGRDVDGVGERIRRFTKASFLSGQVPWILGTLHLFPQVGRQIQEFNDFGQNLAIQRVKNGAGRMDIWYHLADEAGLEKEKPTLETSAADGIIAVIAASDTTASTLSSLVWFLLSYPEYYRRVQQELDSVIVDGDDPFDANKHQELHFLSACINETMRLHPPLLTNGTRQVPLGQPGRHIAGRFIPEGTSIYSPAYALHRNPAYFSHPDQFLPDRWLSGSSLKFEKHDTSAFIPFSLGPANCVGQKFARRELFVVLSGLFKTFEVRFAEGFDGTAWPLGMHDFFVAERAPLQVRLTPR
ncbi:high nitrogen upregulated cytochrome P450 monooxygenase 2 [Mycena albidolilacea]|uniref:High nitrogen upregulated cytochrome P450 monooxygenase 2 n=1 Tax=Mycena albidolilacea TaxID=1033008 RepID=A0AAD6Z8V1_9AGAR|nr:high nitrogen upregulated cytochrome P450 monooxygenase 2 [Mycena albidolilacea]